MERWQSNEDLELATEGSAARVAADVLRATPSTGDDGRRPTLATARDSALTLVTIGSGRVSLRKLSRDDGAYVIGVDGEGAVTSPLLAADPDVRAILHLGASLELEARAGDVFIHGRRIKDGDRCALELGASFIVEDATFVLVAGARRTFEGEVKDLAARGAVACTKPIVASPVMRHLYRIVERVADSPISVLLLGETGAGKEIVADAIHAASPRRKRPFVRLNCAALPATLIDSELFGHERGAFTGAERSKIGLLESAQGGTILLDEIGELPLETQGRLLRTLERREILRVGGVRPLPIDVRFVAATNRDLRAEVAAGRFREDLFFRLDGLTLYVPPLRERPEEIEPLSERFIAEMARELRRPIPTISVEARQALSTHRWPGNLRELRNVLHRAVLLHEGGVIRAEDLLLEPAVTRLAPLEPQLSVPGSGPPRPVQRGGIDEETLREALDRAAGNQTRAAKYLGVSRQTLSKWVARHNLPRPIGSKDEE
ncbi:sigma 54-interacting transcriptional regulator [Myxococcota bacterium]|nr:sigma 54-interacting transcriptional regulator [Myxococcota bacterium]